MSNINKEEVKYSFSILKTKLLGSFLTDGNDSTLCLVNDKELPQFEALVNAYNQKDLLEIELKKSELMAKVHLDQFKENEHLKERVKQLTEALQQIDRRAALLDKGVNNAGNNQISDIWKISTAALQNNTLDNDYKKVWNGK